MQTKNRKGFTLVELLVVVVVLGLLIMLTMSTVLNSLESSQKNVFSSQVLKYAQDVKTTFEQVKMDKGAATPVCYNVDGLKQGSSYKGYIMIDYATGKVNGIHIYDNEFVYDVSDGNPAGTLALDKLSKEKGKAIAKPAPGTGAGAYGTIKTTIDNFITAPTNNCVKPEAALAAP